MSSFATAAVVFDALIKEKDDGVDDADEEVLLTSSLYSEILF